MGKASSAKKVARAARAGGGRRTTGRRNMAFPAAVAGVIVLGLALVVAARQSQDEASATPPLLGDHWHASYGLYACDDFQPPVGEFENREGIHTHGDGVIHIHPFSNAATGAEATLGVFLDGAGIEVSDDALVQPDGQELREGEDDCAGEDAIVQVAKWSAVGDPEEEPEVFTDGLRDLRFLNDGEGYTIAFAPEGTELPRPPTSENLQELGAIDSGQSAPSTTAPASPPTSPPEGAPPASAP